MTRGLGADPVIGAHDQRQVAYLEVANAIEPREGETMTNRVSVVACNGRPYYLRWTDPETDKIRNKSSGTRNRDDALRAAARLEEDLRTGRHAEGGRIGWHEFRDAFGHSKRSLSADTQSAYMSTLDKFIAYNPPASIGGLTTRKVDQFRAHLEACGLAPSSVHHHLRNLKAAARWAHDRGYLGRVPKFDMPPTRDVEVANGRPLDDAEYVLLLETISDANHKDAADMWRTFAVGIRHTGLRLSEVAAIRWDRAAGCPRMVIDPDNPAGSYMEFASNAHKSGKAAKVPLTPHAHELLAPLRKNAGHVFDLPIANRDKTKVSAAFSKYGRLAGIVTEPDKGKCATVHDLRRTFGMAWAYHVPTPALKLMMRHADINTTLKYYAHLDAGGVGRLLWGVETKGSAFGAPGSGLAPIELGNP